jgi:ATP-dependent RNA helicase DHX8/PRP22
VSFLCVYLQDPLDQLNHLALVSRLCKELDAHIGMSDKTLAEFIIDLSDQNPDPAVFNKALIENGAEFGESFVGTLLRIIQSSERNQKRLRSSKTHAVAADTAGDDSAVGDVRAKQFPGLSLKNSAPVASEIYDHYEPGAARRDDRGGDSRSRGDRERSRDEDRHGRDSRDGRGRGSERDDHEHDRDRRDSRDGKDRGREVARPRTPSPTKPTFTRGVGAAGGPTSEAGLGPRAVPAPLVPRFSDDEKGSGRVAPRLSSPERFEASQVDFCF